jgi:hypothetical protein
MKRNSPQFTTKLIKTHLTTTEKELYVYYCNNSFTLIPLFCIDLDLLVNKETGEVLTTEEDLKAAEEYISKILPYHYFEPSTGGQGRHYYFHIDFTDYMEILPIDEILENKHYADFVNDYILKLSNILKEQVNSKFNVHCDAIKGTMSKYEKEKTSGYHIIKKSGVFCKLPIPHNQSDFNRLVHLTPIQFSSVYSFILNNSYSSICSSDLNKKNLKKEIKICKNDNNNNNEKKRNTTVCGDIPLFKPKINILKNKEKDNKKLKYNSNDALERSREAGKIYFSNHWKEHNRLPSCQEYRDYYRIVAGTGAETEYNKKRLEEVYTWLIARFDNSKISKSL